MAPGTENVRPPSVISDGSARTTPIASRAGTARPQSATFAGEATQTFAVLALVSQTTTARSDSGNGSGRSTMRSTAVRMAVVAPMATAIVTTAAANAGVRHRLLSANRRS